MKGILLAGGIASGFGGTLDNPYPKSLEILNGKSVLSYSINGMKILGINEIMLVIPEGLSDKFTDEVNRISQDLGIDIRLIEQKPRISDDSVHNLAQTFDTLEQLSGQIPEIKPDEPVLAAFADVPIIGIDRDSVESAGLYGVEGDPIEDNAKMVKNTSDFVYTIKVKSTQDKDRFYGYAGTYSNLAKFSHDRDKPRNERIREFSPKFDEIVAANISNPERIREAELFIASQGRNLIPLELYKFEDNDIQDEHSEAPDSHRYNDALQSEEPYRPRDLE